MKPFKVPAERAGWKTNCPHCNQRFQVPAPAQPFPAPSSHTVLAPLQPKQPSHITAPPVRASVKDISRPASDPSASDLVEYAPSPPPSRTRPAAVAVIIAVGLVCLLILGLVLPRSAKESRDSASTSQDSTAKDPYAPDCAIIRAWLKDHYGEVEVVSWGRRNIHRFAQLDDYVTLSVRFRLKGERRTKSGYFIIGAGDIVQSAHLSD
jgi:hypothetical protein